MSKSNKKLDKFLRKEKWKQVRNSIFLIPLFIIFLWAIIPNTGKVEEVHGVVTRLIGLPSEEGERLYLLVKLENGEIVRSYIRTSAHFRSRGIVKLYKQAPIFFGKTIYKFQGYSESNRMDSQ